MQRSYSEMHGYETVGFAIADEDVERLDRLTRKFGHGNRSAFLRAAMKQMEVIERAEQLPNSRPTEPSGQLPPRWEPKTP